MAVGDVRTAMLDATSFGCAKFDGVDDYVEIPHSANQLGVNLSDGMSVAGWIKTRSDGETSLGNILDKSSGISGANGFMVNVASSGRVQIRIQTTPVLSSAMSARSNNVWVHFLFTITSGMIGNCYINGVLSGSADVSVGGTLSSITTTNAMRIGNRATATDRTFDGFIRDVRMWNKVLSAADIAKVYAGSPVTDSLIGQWKLNGNANDNSIYGNNGTASGAVFVNDNQTIDAEFTAARVGATDKYFITNIGSGQVATAAIAES